MEDLNEQDTDDKESTVNRDIIFHDISDDWRRILYKGTLKKQLNNIIKNKFDGINLDNVCPSQDTWLEAFRLTSYNNIKVVIIGQKPYHVKDQDHGLSFSSLKCKKTPPSLLNMYKCLIKSKQTKYTKLGDLKKLKSCDLSGWAEQGVLMLNAVLTTEDGNSENHSNIWRVYIRNVIKRLSNKVAEDGKSLVFMLWGNNAKEFKNLINDKHTILEWIHPDQLSQKRIGSAEKFVNCDHFKKCNEILIEQNLDSIKWDFQVYDSPSCSPKPSSNIIKTIELENQITLFDDFDLSGDDSTKHEKFKDGINKQKPDQLSVEDEFKDLLSNEDLSSNEDFVKRKLIIGKPKMKKIKSRKCTAFTDGSCEPNKSCPDSVGGYAAVFTSKIFRDVRIWGNLDNKLYYATNIRAEGMAILKILNYLNDNDFNWDECDIVTDCKHWCDMIINYMPNWSKEKFEEKSNPDLTSSISKMWKMLTLKKSKTLNILHMRSHNKDGWGDEKIGTYKRFCYDNNDYVDQMSKYARLNLTAGDCKIDTIEYDD
jgi:uracil-DNA glycosylase